MTELPKTARLSPKSVAKKRRHESQTQREFDNATNRMTHTFASLQHKLCSKNFKQLTLSEKIRFCNQLENDFKTKQFDVLNVKQIAERLLEELQNEPTDDVKKKLNTFLTQYNNIETSIQDFKDLIEFDTEKDFFYTELSDLKLVLADFQNSFKTVTPGNQAREYKKQLIIMTSYEERIQRLKNKLQELTTRQIASEADSKLMQNDVDNFCKGWDVIIQQISSPKQQDKCKKLQESLEALNAFLEKTKKELSLLDAQNLYLDVEMMQNKMKTLLKLKSKSTAMKSDYDFVIQNQDDGQNKELKADWLDLIDNLEDKMRKLSTGEFRTLCSLPYMYLKYELQLHFFVCISKSIKDALKYSVGCVDICSNENNKRCGGT